MGFPFRLLLLLAAAGTLRADPALDQAIALYQGKHYAEAGAALRSIVAAEPHDAAACYYLGLALSQRGDARALDDAVPWLEQATLLDPKNARYLGDYGGTCLQLADQHRSFTYATRGRTAMEQAIALDPDNLDARRGLMQFYARAPWPLGSAARARAQADEILRRDPTRGPRTFLLLGRALEKAGNRSGAREAYGVVLRLEPDNRDALAGAARVAPLVPQ